MNVSIIFDDIRQIVYDCDEYPTMEETEYGSTLIPCLLIGFLTNYIRIDAVTNRKCTAIVHSIILACRPRSFISPVFFAVAVYYISIMKQKTNV
jgi:hypothetical protein